MMPAASWSSQLVAGDCRSIGGGVEIRMKERNSNTAMADKSFR